MCVFFIKLGVVKGCSMLHAVVQSNECKTSIRRQSVLYSPKHVKCNLLFTID